MLSFKTELKGDDFDVDLSAYDNKHLSSFPSHSNQDDEFMNLLDSTLNKPSYDTVSIFVPGIQDFDTSYLNKQRSKHSNREIYFLGNIRISKIERGLLITGSASRYMHGCNIFILDHQSIREYFDQIENILNIPLDHATISRLDIAVNLKMDQPVNEYVDGLIDLRWMPRRDREYESSVLFANDTRSFQMYDKIIHLSDHTLPNDPFYKWLIHESSEHMLRLELQWKRLRSRRQQAVLIEELSSKEFFEDLTNDLLTTYGRITKDRLNLPKLFQSRWKDDFFKALVLEGVRARGGIQSLLNQLHFSSSKKSRRKKELLNLYNTLNDPDSYQPITELDNKVQQACRHYISHESV